MSNHIAPLSFQVTTTLSAQRIVAMDGSNAHTVAYPANLQTLPIGITTDTVDDTNQAIPVAGPGNIAKLYFNDTVSAGGLVGSDSSGRGIPVTLANTTTAITLAAAHIGVLVDAAVAATATIAKVLIIPGFARGT